MRLSLIVAMTPDRLIGRAGDLPWRLSADLQRFKRLTMGHTLIMGRKTFESIGRLLPGRKTVIVTRQADYRFPEATVVHSLEAAIESAAQAGESEAFIIGGGEIYQQSLELVTQLHVTLVHAEVDGDTYFPDVDFTQWKLVEDEQHQADGKNEFDYSFRVYERVDAAHSSELNPAASHP